MSTRDHLNVPGGPRPKAAPRSARSGEAPQPWTATRCQRLLRPLVSRIASLRKDIAVSSSKPADQAPGTQRAGAKRHSGDCDWLLPNKKAKLHRTYSQRRSRGSTQSEPGSDATTSGFRTAAKLRGEIVPPTPLLRRARGHAVLSSAQNPGATANRESRPPPQDVPQASESKARKRQTLPQKQLDDRLAALKPELPPGRHSDYEAIYRSLEALLVATNANSGEEEKRGPRSFLDMCLRKVPQYITKLEAWERSEAEENGTYSALENMDTSMYIYDYLESLGAGQGWRHLRSVVRADGLKALKDAVAEGLLDDAFLELLIDLCVVTGAPREAEELLEAMVQREYPGPDSPDTSFAELTQPLLVLWSYANKVGRPQFLIRQHTLLLSNGNLPRDWLGTREFERIWNLAVQGVSKAEAADEAVEFMIRAISLLCTRKRKPGKHGEQPQPERELSAAGQQALASALATIAAMSSLSEHEMQSPEAEAAAAEALCVRNRLQYILQASLAEVSTSSRSQAIVGTRLLHLALFLSSAECQDEKVVCTVRESIEAIDRSQRAGDYDNNAISNRSRERLRQQYDAMISLISSTARSRARGLALPSHDCLDALFRQLGEALDLEEAGVLGRIKAAAAFTLAQQTHNVRDLIYAEKLNPGSSSSSAALRGTSRIGAGGNEGSGDEEEPQARPLFAGYRWDASIGEWVTVSPVKQRPRATAAGRRLLRSSTGGLGLRPQHQRHDQEQSPPRDHRRLPARVKVTARPRDSGSQGTATSSYLMTRGRLGPDDAAGRTSCVRRRHSSCPQEVGRNRSRTAGPVAVHCDPITPPRSFKHIYMSTAHPDSPKTALEPTPAPIRTPVPLPAPATAKATRTKLREGDPQEDELGHAEGQSEDEDEDKENRGRQRAGHRGSRPRKLSAAPHPARAPVKRLSVLAASAPTRMGRHPRSLGLLRRSIASMGGDSSSEDELGL